MELKRTHHGRNSWPLLAIAAMSLVPHACSVGRSQAEERGRRADRSRGDVVVAAAWPWKRRNDIDYRQGLEMAVQEINAAGGVNNRQLRLQQYDDGESIDEGNVVAQKICNDYDVMAVIGHLQSYITIPVAPVYEMAGLVLIAPTATDPSLTAHGYRRVFQATFTDRDTGKALAELARKRHRRMAIVYVRNAYGRGLANAFEDRANEIGLLIVARRSYDSGEDVSGNTFAPIIREWKALELDAILLAGEVPSAAHFVAQARAEGLLVPIFGGDAMSDPILMRVAGPAAEGMTLLSFFHPDEPRPEVQKFKAAYERREGASPGAGAALGYDAIYLLARGMQNANSAAPDEVARALHHMPRWNGVTGGFRFDANGAAVDKRPILLIVRNGRFAYLPEED
jgi:branched-chain amino acid transport system substrate-binding protein